MQAKKSSRATENRNRPKRRWKLNLCEWRNWSIQVEELVVRITP